MDYVPTKADECSREALKRFLEKGRFLENEDICKNGVVYYRFGSKTRRFVL